MTEKEQTTESKKRRWRVSRRGFLIGLGATGLAVAVGIKLAPPAVHLRMSQMFNEPPDLGGVEGVPQAWFEINADNQATLFLPKSEMGQGVHTALAQIAAEELGMAWEQITVVHASTDQGVVARPTGGSNSISSMFDPLRESAATLREMLRQEAAIQLGVAAESFNLADGVFSVKADPDTAVTYGQIIQNKQDEWVVPEEAPPLKPISEFKFIGQAMERVDFLDKLTAQATYGYDVRLPDMVYGAVARPPVLGSTINKASAGEAMSKPGVISVITEDNFAGVIAESRAQAKVAANALDVEWSEAKAWQQAELEDFVTVGNGKVVIIQKEGDAPGNLESAADVIRAEYRTPMAAHAHLEPQAALAHVTPDKVTVWVSTQSPFLIREELAALLEREESEIEVITTYLGGGFGRKLNTEAATEAALLSKATGRPVHVGWDRTEDLRYGYFRPLTHHVLQAALDDNGRITAMAHETASGDVAFTFQTGIIPLLLGADFGAWRGAFIGYDLPHKQTTAYRITMPIRTGWWRGLGLLANTFALESFMDELAAAAGIDPLQFRLNHLADDERGQRVKRVLEAAADAADWGSPAADGRGRGIAWSVDTATIVAQVAEVSVNDGRVQVHKVTSAVDPGLIINPDGVIAQTQGAINMGLSSTLYEEITVKDGMVEASNFDRYPLLTMQDTPDIEVVLLESGERPYGMGEPPIGPIAAAVGNAVFAVTGERQRRLPLQI